MSEKTKSAGARHHRRQVAHPAKDDSSRQANRLAQATIDALTAHICVVDENGVILAVNEAWRKFGRDNPPVPSHSFLGENYLAVCDQATGENTAEAASFAAGLRSVVRGKRAKFGLEYPCHAPGDYRWFVARVTRLPGAGPAHAVVAHENITERKRAEELLRDSEERYRGLFEVESDALFLVDRETGRFIDANPAAEKMYGFSRKDFLKLKAADVSSEPENTRKAISQGKTWTPLCWHRRKDGTVFPVEIGGGYFEYQGHQVHVAAVRDISERERAQDELRRSQEGLRRLAARIERVREDERIRIAREIHDELGHVMTDLRLDLAWVSRRLGEVGITARSAVRRRIVTMSQRAEASAHIVRRIATELRPAVLDTLGLAAAIEWQGREFQQRTRIKCQVQIPGKLPSLGAAQSSAMFRMFQELLSNVAQHARASSVQVRLAKRQGRLHLQVSDNGRGITKAEQGSPIALGLLGVHERAMILGGAVAVAGLPRRGTTITISLPIDPV